MVGFGDRNFDHENGPTEQPRALALGKGATPCALKVAPEALRVQSQT
jgi:hypothetical protein